MLVIDVKSTSSSDTLPSFLSNVDPHEDDALLHYLQFGRHLAGQSKKKCKNVLLNAKHYKYADNKLWYRKDVTSANLLEVPKRQKRYDLKQHKSTWSLSDTHGIRCTQAYLFLASYA